MPYQPGVGTRSISDILQGIKTSAVEAIKPITNQLKMGQLGSDNPNLIAKNLKGKIPNTGNRRMHRHATDRLKKLEKIKKADDAKIVKPKSGGLSNAATMATNYANLAGILYSTFLDRDRR